jgi:hypothetical protein
LLLDDTWVSGGSAQSAAVALKRAGSRLVATVVLGRHVAAGAVPASAVSWPGILHDHGIPWDRGALPVNITAKAP